MKHGPVILFCTCRPTYSIDVEHPPVIEVRNTHQSYLDALGLKNPGAFR